MTFRPNYPELGSKRLQRFDYSQPGAYFVTICAFNRRCIFGEITHGRMMLNHNGAIVKEQWYGLASHYPNISLDTFVIMPNHIHGIICINEVERPFVGAGFQPADAPPQTNPQHGLPEIIRGFKTYSARGINKLRDTSGTPDWQRNYFEHIVRSKTDLDVVRRYIEENPLKWNEDYENPMFRPSLDSSSKLI